MLTALDFGPFPLYLAQRAEPGLRRAPLVITDEQHVLHANTAARRHGVTPGMRLEGARMRVSGLEVRAFQEPDLEHAWRALLRELYDLTPWLEGDARGRAFARLQRAEAEEVARRYDARVGLAPDAETAELAALTATPGNVREVLAAQREGFLARLPLRFLKGVGLSAANLTRLQWLGLATAADLARWSAAQLRAYLGEEGDALLAYLHGPRRVELRPYRLPPSIQRSLSFPEPVREPHQILPALDRLAVELERALAGRAARRLTLTATLAGSQRRASRLAKRPLRQARHIRQQALFALHDSRVEGSPIERLTLELAAPERVGVQASLWPGRERRARALTATLERFPAAPKRVAWRDPYAQAADLTWAWEGYVDVNGVHAGPDALLEGAATDATARQAGAPDARPAAMAAAVPLFAPSEPAHPAETPLPPTATIRSRAPRAPSPPPYPTARPRP